MKKILRLGTRGSPLALVRAQIARKAILSAHPDFCAECEIEIVPIRTNDDYSAAQKESSFYELSSYKNMFTKDLEEALLSGMIDIAVHSMKDVSVLDCPDLHLVAMLARGDPRDAFLSSIAPRIEDLPQGARLAVSSLRRGVQALVLRPDLNVVPMCGNVDMLMKKLISEEVDAMILAVAGLERLGVQDRIASFLTLEQMLPFPGQGILGLQIRAHDEEIKFWLDPVNHQDTFSCAMAERAMLRTLDASYSIPIAGLATLSLNGQCQLDGLVASQDGKIFLRKQMTAPLADAEKLGQTLGEAFKAELPEEIFKV